MEAIDSIFRFVVVIKPIVVGVFTVVEITANMYTNQNVFKYAKVLKLKR